MPYIWKKAMSLECLIMHMSINCIYVVWQGGLDLLLFSRQKWKHCSHIVPNNHGIPAGVFSTPVLQMRVTLEKTDEQRSLLLSYRSLVRGMRHSAVTMEALVRALRNSNPGISMHFSLKTHPNTTNTLHQNTQTAFCLQTMSEHKIPFSNVLYDENKGNHQRYMCLNA